MSGGSSLQYIALDLYQCALLFLGQYVCRLAPAASLPGDDLVSLVSGLDLAMNLRAVVTEREGGQQQVSSSILTLPYIAAFYAHATEIHISDAIPTAALRITAAPRLRDTLKVRSQCLLTDDGEDRVKC